MRRSNPEGISDFATQEAFTNFAEFPAVVVATVAVEAAVSFDTNASVLAGVWQAGRRRH